VLSGLLPVSSRLKLRQVPVVVTLHLQVENLALTRGRRGDQVVIQELQNAGADFAELLLHLTGQNH
jgi:hypothetical protein